MKFFGKKKRKITSNENRKLEEFGLMYMGLLDEMKKRMEGKTSEEIMDIMDITNRLEKKNCWFAVFRVKELIRSAGRNILKGRTPKLKIDEVIKQRHITEEEVEKEEEIETEEQVSEL